jgi:hypothetical protein
VPLPLLIEHHVKVEKGAIEFGALTKGDPDRAIEHAFATVSDLARRLAPPHNPVDALFDMVVSDPHHGVRARQAELLVTCPLRPTQWENLLAHDDPVVRYFTARKRNDDDVLRGIAGWDSPIGRQALRDLSERGELPLETAAEAERRCATALQRNDLKVEVCEDLIETLACIGTAESVEPLSAPHLPKRKATAAIRRIQSRLGPHASGQLSVSNNVGGQLSKVQGGEVDLARK